MVILTIVKGRNVIVGHRHRGKSGDSCLFFGFCFCQQRDNDSVSGESGDETDPFNDPDDKWEKDFKLDSSSSRFVCVTGGVG